MPRKRAAKQCALVFRRPKARELAPLLAMSNPTWSKRFPGYNAWLLAILDPGEGEGEGEEGGQ